MKKILMAFLMMGLMSAVLFAELMQDAKTFRYYSIPASSEINQAEYHYLVWDCKDLQKTGASYRVPVQIQNKIITEYLQRIATATSIRLLADLQKKNFVF
jgi:hypothetical protein